MNTFKVITDAGNYAGIPDEYASEAILAYAMSIEDRGGNPSQLTEGEAFGELREMVRRELNL